MHGVLLGIVLGILLVFLYLMAENYTVAKPLGKVVTLHHTEWCPACKAFRPQWDRIKNDLQGLGVAFQEVDEDVAHTPGIPGVPTIMMYDVDGFRYMYKGPRTIFHVKQWIMAPRKQQSAPSAT
jgi:hypothetical protein